MYNVLQITSNIESDNKVKDAFVEERIITKFCNMLNIFFYIHFLIIMRMNLVFAIERKC